MSLGHGSSIVRDGLIFYMDPKNTKCYSGTGISLNNLATKNNNIQPRLVNGPVVTDGEIIFDGVNDSIRMFNTDTSTFTIGNPPDISSTEEFTIEQIFKPTFITTENFFSLRNQLLRKGAGASTLHFWTNIDTNTTFRFYARNSTEILKSVQFTTPEMLNKINAVTITVSGFNVSCYHNGNFLGTQTISTNFIESRASDTMGIGDLGVSATWFTGSYYNCKIYNRSLSPQEIQQNFEATRGRYGL